VQITKLLHNDNRGLLFKEAHKITLCVAGRNDVWESEPKDESYFLSGGVDDGIRNNQYPVEPGFALFMSFLIGDAIFGAIHCCGWFLTLVLAKFLALTLASDRTLSCISSIKSWCFTHWNYGV
jgi:hypothetical protein